MLLKTVLFGFLVTAVHAGPMDSTKELQIQICNENNATDKVDQVKILMDEYIECKPQTIDIINLAAEFNGTLNGTVDEVARKVCAKVDQTKKCLAKVHTAAALCAKNDDDLLIFLSESSIRTIEYLCYEEDGRTRLAKYVDDGGFRCSNTRSIKMEQCGTPVSPGVKAFYENIWRCTINELKKCSEPAAKRVQGLIDYIMLNGRPSRSNNQLL